MNIKMLRQKTGLSQGKFAKKYDIPLNTANTLRHWEQGISRPADYLLKLLEKDICIEDEIVTFSYEDRDYKYNITRMQLSDKDGNIINIEINNAKTMRPDNIGLYCEMIFEDYYEMIKDLHDRCSSDENNNIIWKKFY